EVQQERARRLEETVSGPRVEKHVGVLWRTRAAISREAPNTAQTTLEVKPRKLPPAPGDVELCGAMVVQGEKDVGGDAQHRLLHVCIPARAEPAELLARGDLLQEALIPGGEQGIQARLHRAGRRNLSAQPSTDDVQRERRKIPLLLHHEREVEEIVRIGVRRFEP